MCRAPWDVSEPWLHRAHACTAGCAAGAASPANDQLEPEPGGSGEGFLNLGALQPGVQTVRDTSSYSSWLAVHERNREAAALTGAGSPAKGASPARAQK